MPDHSQICHFLEEKRLLIFPSKILGIHISSTPPQLAWGGQIYCAAVNQERAFPPKILPSALK
jgi:hypothetical protein